MKNLENLNLQELTIEEQTNTDGGLLCLALAAAACVTKGVLVTAAIGVAIGSIIKCSVPKGHC